MKFSNKFFVIDVNLFDKFNNKIKLQQSLLYRLLTNGWPHGPYQHAIHCDLVQRDEMSLNMPVHCRPFASLYKVFYYVTLGATPQNFGSGGFRISASIILPSSDRDCNSVSAFWRHS